MRRKALVTGGTGFIGRALVERLLSLNWEVTIMTRGGGPDSGRAQRYSTRTVPCDDLRNMGSVVHNVLRADRPDAIFHLAAMQSKEHSSVDVTDMLLANVGLGAHLMEAACVLGGIPFVNVGSYWQYFEGRESDPVNLYAATKSGLQEIAKYYINVRSNPIVNLILVDAYGENDNRGKILDLLIGAAISGKRINLSQGEQRLDYIHVSDVVAGLIHAVTGLECGSIPPGSYALGTGINVTLRALAKIVAEVTGREVLSNWGAWPYPPRQIMNTRIPHPPLPGWQPQVALPEGVAKMWAAARGCDGVTNAR